MFDTQTIRLLFKPECESIIVPMIEITPGAGDTWPDGSTDTLYFCAYDTDLVVNGNTYKSFGFSVVLPTQASSDEISSQAVKIDFENVSQEITEHFRNLQNEARVKLFYVNADSPATEQVSFPNLKLVNMKMTAEQIQCELIFFKFLSTKLTSETYDTDTYPGLL